MEQETLRHAELPAPLPRRPSWGPQACDAHGPGHLSTPPHTHTTPASGSPKLPFSPTFTHSRAFLPKKELGPRSARLASLAARDRGTEAHYGFSKSCCANTTGLQEVQECAGHLRERLEGIQTSSSPGALCEDLSRSERGCSGLTSGF